MLGASLAEYDEMTPRELSLKRQAHKDLKKAEAEEYQIKYKNDEMLATVQAYQISRWVWAKKLDIEKILKGLDKKPKEAMTNEQMLAQVKALNALFGGEVKENGEE